MEKYLMNLDTEGRYLFLNAIADQLRYPRVFLFLWSSVSREIIQEQITRMLLEWLIVNQHNPWGPLITFMELIKNPRYKFWVEVSRLVNQRLRNISEHFQGHVPAIACR
ncbi:CNOT1 protein [Populus alba x Populus x berolinensis]|nr:CNOT1 protein [Populus alba x Populus x berolinensis]